MYLYLGIDWGGTYIKVGLVNKEGQLKKKIVCSSESLKNKDVFLKKIEDILKKNNKFKIKGIGIGAPGIIDLKKGFIYYLPNIPGWENYPLKDILTKRLSLPVVIDNDANLFALAEARLGAAKGASRAVFLTLGTGLGGAVIINGKLLEGRNTALELGHVPISLKGKKCSCGSRGCIETFVGNKYLLKRYNQLKKGKVRIKDVKEIFQKGMQGEREALVVWKEFSYALGKFLAGMVNIFSPEIIVIGGGVSGAFRLFKPLVLEVVKKEAMWPQAQNLKISKAKLKDAGIIGAAILAKEKIR
jgi:glucokinase